MFSPKRIVTAILILLLSAFILFYSYMQIIGVRRNTFETETALYVTIENNISSVGYILRDEVLLDSDAQGTSVEVVSDGQKVSGGEVVANIYNSKADAGSKARIDEINEKLEILKNSGVDQEYFSADISKFEKSVEEQMKKIQKSKAENDFSDCIGRKNDLFVQMNKLQSVKLNISFDEEIQKLEAEKSRLSIKSSNSYKSVYAPKSGYYYCSADGYEKVYTKDKLYSLTYELYNELINEAPSEIPSGCAGKIVSGFKWYLLTDIQKSDAAMLGAGENYDIFFPYSSDITINMTLEKIISETDKPEDILVFSTGDMPEKFNFLRSQKVQIIGQKYKGLKVPKSAMRMLEDGTKGVYVLSGEIIRFKLAQEIYSFDDYYIIGTDDELYSGYSDSKYRRIELYDNVIISGKDLYDGKKIK